MGSVIWCTVYNERPSRMIPFSELVFVEIRGIFGHTSPRPVELQFIPIVQNLLLEKVRARKSNHPRVLLYVGP